MKSIFKNILLASVTLVFFACNDSEDLVTDNALEGGLIEPTATSNNYVVGNPGPYTVEFLVDNREDIFVETITLYKSFTGSDVYEAKDGSDSTLAYTTNEVLAGTINVTNTGVHYVTIDFTFDQLIEGLTREDMSGAQYIISDGGEGGDLPSNDGAFIIGDTWSFRAELDMSDGRTLAMANTVNFTVSTRYAGTYAIKEHEYWRAGVLESFEWPSEIQVVSVNATTYQMIGFALFDDQNVFFQIDPVTSEITYPDGQQINELDLITCQSNPNDLVNVRCGSSNMAEPVDSGADILTVSSGYLGSTGPREFYWVMEKIVD